MFVWKPSLVFLSFVLGLTSAEAENSLSYRETCPKFQIRKSTIIKTQQSIHDGAEFLGKKVTTSSRGCHEHCCKTNGCNLVMLKYNFESSEEKVSCFMFNCRSPSVCTFFQHSSYHSYAALEYEDKKPRYSPKDYGKTKDYKTDDKVKTTGATTEAPKPTTAEDAYRKWGNINWFRATTTRKPMYMHKKPKSDNSGYDRTNSWERKNVLDDQDLDKLSTTHHFYNHKTTDTKKSNPWHIDESVPKRTSTGRYGTYDHTQNADTFKIPTQKTTPADEEEDFPRRVFVDNNPDFPDEPHYRRTEPPHRHTEPETEETIMRTTKSPGLKITKVTTTKSPPGNHFIIKRLNIQDNKAVIPLAIGLVLALLLLLGVIFRLKTSRRRRTKAFLTDDADYLINGMYL